MSASDQGILLDFLQKENQELLLTGFLDELKRNGFSVTPDRIAELQIVLRTLATDGGPQDVKSLVCPIFATSPKEQTFFYRLFDRYFEGIQLAAPVLEEKPPPSGKAPFEEKKAATSPPARLLKPTAAFWTAQLIALTVLTALSFMAWVDAHIAAFFERPWVEGLIAVVAGFGIAGVFGVLLRDLSHQYRRFLIWGITLFAAYPGFAVWVPNVVYSWMYKILLGFIGLGLLGLFVQWLRRKPEEKEKETGEKRKLRAGPLTYRPDVPFPQTGLLTKGDSLLLNRAVNRQRMKDYNTAEIDVKRTLERTIQLAGFIELHYKKASEPPTYLILFDLKSGGDYQKEWFRYIQYVLAEGGTKVEVYYYENSPVYCWHQNGDKVLLESIYAGQRLLVFGAGSSLVDTVEGEVYRSARDLFYLWTEKALLTPKPVSRWGQEEMLLEREFYIAPASIEGMLSAVDFFEHLSEKRVRDWVEESPLEINEIEDINLLRESVSEPVFHWIAACAVYPQIYWSLTLHLGEMLETYANELLNKENLSLLNNIVWFRSGRMPGQARRRLIAALPPQKERRVREVIMELLQREGSAPPEESYAYEDYRTIMLRNRYELAENRIEQNSMLQALQNQVAAAGTEDEEVLEMLAAPLEAPVQEAPAEPLRPLPEQRGVTGAFRRLLAKKIGKGDADQLTWVSFQEEKIYRFDAGLEKKIREAHRILLLIHGLGGDTLQMAEGIRRLYNEGSFDLILAFDYENLSTKLEDSAESLKNNLEKVGLLPDSVKKLSVLAHSSGALVARYYIERLGGNAVVEQLVMCGPPNAGSGIASLSNLLQGAIRFVFNLIPFSGSILNTTVEFFGAAVLKELDPAPENPFLKELNQSPDPYVPYKIIAGNLEGPWRAEGDGWFSLLFLRWMVRLAFGGKPNDMVVSVESARAVPPGRSLEPVIVEVPVPSFGYFTQPAGLDAIHNMLRWEKPGTTEEQWSDTYAQTTGAPETEEPLVEQTIEPETAAPDPLQLVRESFGRALEQREFEEVFIKSLMEVSPYLGEKLGVMSKMAVENVARVLRQFRQVIEAALGDDRARRQLPYIIRKEAEIFSDLDLEPGDIEPLSETLRLTVQRVDSLWEGERYDYAWREVLQPVVVELQKEMERFWGGRQRQQTSAEAPPESPPLKGFENAAPESDVPEGATNELERIRRMISEGRIGEALEAMQEIAERPREDNFLNDVLLQKGRYEENERQYRLRLVDETTYSQVRNRITGALLTLLDQLPDMEYL